MPVDQQNPTRPGSGTSKGGYGGSNKERRRTSFSGAGSDGWSTGDPLLDRVLREYDEARSEANAANEERYDKVLELYDQLNDKQRDQLADMDDRHGVAGEKIGETAASIGNQISGIRDNAVAAATGKGEQRVSGVSAEYIKSKSELGALSKRATEDIAARGEKERTGVLGRAKEALGRLRGEQRDLADKSDVRRGEAGEDIRGGFEGQQAEQRGGYRAAREDVAGLYSKGGERVRSEFDRGVSEAGERFKGGRGDVGEGYREAGERAGDIGGGLADRISGMSAQSLRDLVSSAEGRLGDLGEGFRDVGRGQEERIARSRGEAGEIIGGERERQEGEFARGAAESEGRFGRGRERVQDQYAEAGEEAGGRYARRGEEGRSLLRGLGDAAKGRISRDFDAARTKRLGGIEQDLIRRGLENTTIRSGARREARSEFDRNEQEALGRLEDQLRREEAGAFERYSGAEQQARDRLQAGGLGAGSQFTGAELAAQEGREGQRAARSGQLGQTAIGADLAAAQRGEAAAQQAGMAGAGQDVAGQTQIAQLEQLLGREGLGQVISALGQGAGAQLGLLGQGAGAGANVTGAGLSAQQNVANQGLAAGTGMAQNQIAALQQLIGNQLGAQQQTALTGLGTQAQMAGQRSAAGENLGLAGLGQQAAGNQAMLGADRAIGAQGLAGQIGQIGTGVAQQAGLTQGQLGALQAGGQQLTGLEGSLAQQGAGAGYQNQSQLASLLASNQQSALSAAERANAAASQTDQNRADFIERREDVAPSFEGMANLAMGYGSTGRGGRGTSSLTGGGTMGLTQGDYFIPPGLPGGGMGGGGFGGGGRGGLVPGAGGGGAGGGGAGGGGAGGGGAGAGGGAGGGAGAGPGGNIQLTGFYPRVKPNGDVEWVTQGQLTAAEQTKLGDGTLKELTQMDLSAIRRQNTANYRERSRVEQRKELNRNEQQKREAAAEAEKQRLERLRKENIQRKKLGLPPIKDPGPAPPPPNPWIDPTTGTFYEKDDAGNMIFPDNPLYKPGNITPTEPQPPTQPPTEPPTQLPTQPPTTGSGADLPDPPVIGTGPPKTPDGSTGGGEFDEWGTLPGEPPGGRPSVITGTDGKTLYWNPDEDAYTELPPEGRPSDGDDSGEPDDPLTKDPVEQLPSDPGEPGSPDDPFALDPPPTRPAVEGEPGFDPHLANPNPVSRPPFVTPLTPEQLGNIEAPITDKQMEGMMPVIPNVEDYIPDFGPSGIEREIRGPEGPPMKEVLMPDGTGTGIWEPDPNWTPYEDTYRPEVDRKGRPINPTDPYPEEYNLEDNYEEPFDWGDPQPVAPPVDPFELNPRPFELPRQQTGMYPGDNVGGGMGLVAGGPGGMQGGGGGMGRSIGDEGGMQGGGGLVAGGGGMGRNMAGLGQGGGMGRTAGGGVVTPPFNPNDIAGTQGGRKPFLPGVPGTGDMGQGGGMVYRGGAPPQLADVAKRATQPQGPGMVVDGRFVGADFSTQQGGNPAVGGKMDSGMEAQWRANNPGKALPNQSNDTPLGGLKLLANQSQKKPTRTLAQTYRPNKYGISSGIRT